MLNLARNLLSIVENLNGLDSLTELNLRHNQVSAIVRNKTSFSPPPPLTFPSFFPSRSTLFLQLIESISPFQVCQILDYPTLFCLCYFLAMLDFYNLKMEITVWFLLQFCANVITCSNKSLGRSSWFS